MPESALTVKTVPGTHRCSWTLSKPPHEETWQSEGDVTLLGDRQPAGAVYGRAPVTYQTSPTGGLSAGFPQKFQYPIVRGELVNGRDVILVDAMLRSWQEDRGGIMSGANLNFA